MTWEAVAYEEAPVAVALSPAWALCRTTIVIQSLNPGPRGGPGSISVHRPSWEPLFTSERRNLETDLAHRCDTTLARDELARYHLTFLQYSARRATDSRPARTAESPCPRAPATPPAQTAQRLKHRAWTGLRELRDADYAPPLRYLLTISLPALGFKIWIQRALFINFMYLLIISKYLPHNLIYSLNL